VILGDEEEAQGDGDGCWGEAEGEEFIGDVAEVDDIDVGCFAHGTVDSFDEGDLLAFVHGGLVMPIKDRAVAEPAMARKLPAAAPYLMMGLCSDCRVAPDLLAGGDLKVCPECYALLWHRDFAVDNRRRQFERAEAERTRLAMLRKAKEELRARRRKDEPGGVVSSGNVTDEAGAGVCGEGGSEVSGADDQPVDGG